MEQGTMGAGLNLGAVQEFVMNSMPLAAVAHSFHVDALNDPNLRSDPNFQQFSLIELNELHHQVAALGSLMRLQMGDRTALQSLGTNLAGFLANRQAAMQMAQRLPAAVTQDPRMQVVMALTDQSNNQVAQNLPVLMQTVQLSGSPALRPLLVGNP